MERMFWPILTPWLINPILASKTWLTYGLSTWIIVNNKSQQTQRVDQHNC